MGHEDRYDEHGELVGEIRIRLYLGKPPRATFDEGLKLADGKEGAQWLRDYLMYHRRIGCENSKDPAELADESWERRNDYKLRKALEAATEEVEWPHKCPHCRKRYKTAGWVARHIAAVHTVHIKDPSAYPARLKGLCGAGIRYMGLARDLPDGGDNTCTECVAIYRQTAFGDSIDTDQETNF